MVPFMDLSRIHEPLQEEFVRAFTRVSTDGRYIMGPDVAALEADVARYLGVAHAVGVSSGTDALLAALMAINVGQGDEVIVPSFTFFATAGVVARLGAKPVFTDIDPNTLLMDSAQALSLKSARTRAVIPVHLYGQCAPLADYHDAGLTVIEDAAQAMGATDAAGAKAGGLGAMGCFSFFPTKTLGGFGDGGMVTTNNPDLADRLRLVRVHGARPKFHHNLVGGNFRLDTLQAALLRIKLPHLDAWGAMRQALASRYDEALTPWIERGDIQRVQTLAGTHVFHQYVIRVSRRDALRDALATNVGTAIYYPEPLHLQPCFADLGYRAGDLPVVERVCSEVLALPCFPGLSDTEQHHVINALGAFFGS
jgi:dTDP-4-amino-4,6-dideoxygalactose transaminase